MCMDCVFFVHHQMLLNFTMTSRPGNCTNNRFASDVIILPCPIFNGVYSMDKQLHSKWSNGCHFLHTWPEPIYSLLVKCARPDSKVPGPVGPRWAPWWPHELCYLGAGTVVSRISTQVTFWSLLTCLVGYHWKRNWVMLWFVAKEFDMGHLLEVRSQWLHQHGHIYQIMVRKHFGT